MEIDAKINKWREENKSELKSLYCDYLESMIKSHEVEQIEDWKTWTEREWTRENIPF